MMSPIARQLDPRDVFSELPEFDPDPSLWGRIQTANVRRVRLRRLRHASVIGAILLGVATTWLWEFPQRLTISAERLSSVNWRAHSQELQDQWSQRADRDMDPHIQAHLRLLDSELQAAYDRGAAEPELAPLWLLRGQLLQSLVENESGRSRRMTRI